MLLYHYSKEKFDILRTRENRGEPKVPLSPDFHYIPGRYGQHISFFFDPVPSALIAEFYGPSHPTWHHGNVLQEYVVESKDIGSFKYHIVETPEHNDLILDDDISPDDYYNLYPTIAKKEGYIGEGNHELEKAAKQFVGKLRDNLRSASKLPGWKEVNNKKYAPFIPHLMLYPANGTIPVKEFSTVKIH